MQNWFQKLISVDQNIVMVILLVIFYTVEQLLNKPFEFKKRSLHLVHGIPLQLGYMAVNATLAFIVVVSVQWITNHHIGLFNQIEISSATKIITGLLCIDFTFYWAHRLYHTWALPWRCHRVHHSDINLDSTTFFRFHPFDAILDNTVAIIACAIFGIGMNTLILFSLVNLVFNILQHSNFIFPKWIDSVLGKVFLTPNMHKIHHHQNQFYTDSNFGLIFIFWDKIFGTYKYIPVQEIKYGLEEFDDKKKQTFWYLLKSPFLNIKRVIKHDDDKLHITIMESNAVKSK